MKRFIYLLPFILIVFTACEKKDDNNLEVKITQAFAFDTDGQWEVNLPATVRGFKTSGKEGSGDAKISYSIDVTDPSGKTAAGIHSGTEEITLIEVKEDFTIDIQFYLDTIYVPGDYQITLNLKDELSGKTAMNKAELQLSK